MRRPLALVLLVAVAGVPTAGWLLRADGPVRRVVGGPTYTVGGSMEPSLLRGDRIRCSHDVPDPLRRGAVIVFRAGDSPWSPRPDATFIKRVVGLPGERIVGDEDGIVRVNGSGLTEPYAARDPFPSPFDEVTVPAGTYFVLGDNRGGSADSRLQGPVGHADVVAVCTRIVSPGGRRGDIPGT